MTYEQALVDYKNLVSIFNLIEGDASEIAESEGWCEMPHKAARRDLGDRIVIAAIIEIMEGDWLTNLTVSAEAMAIDGGDPEVCTVTLDCSINSYL